MISSSFIPWCINTTHVPICLITSLSSPDQAVWEDHILTTYQSSLQSHLVKQYQNLTFIALILFGIDFLLVSERLPGQACLKQSFLNISGRNLSAHLHLQITALVQIMTYPILQTLFSKFLIFLFQCCTHHTCLLNHVHIIIITKYSIFNIFVQLQLHQIQSCDQ